MPPAPYQRFLCNSFDVFAQDANSLDEPEGHSDAGTNSLGVLLDSTADSCSNSTTLGCSAFAIDSDGDTYSDSANERVGMIIATDTNGNRRDRGGDRAGRSAALILLLRFARSAGP